jgi:hypothetical protein
VVVNMDEMEEHAESFKDHDVVRPSYAHLRRTRSCIPLPSRVQCMRMH